LRLHFREIGNKVQVVVGCVGDRESLADLVNRASPIGVHKFNFSVPRLSVGMGDPPGRRNRLKLVEKLIDKLELVKDVKFPKATEGPRLRRLFLPPGKVILAEYQKMLYRTREQSR
jgi:hypothetical protein